MKKDKPQPRALEEERYLDIVGDVKKHLNPYPKKVFPEPTKKQYQLFHEYLVSKGTTLDRFSGAWGRRVWDNCCKTIIEEIKARE